MSNRVHSSQVDSTTAAPISIDVEHHQIHSGKNFFLSNYFTVANAANLDFVLLVGANECHFTYSINSDNAGFTFIAYEGITANADGTLLTVNNNDRESSNTSTVTIRQNPTGIVTTSATQLRRGYAGTGGIASSRSAGSINRGNEVILKPATKYLLRITNLSTSNNDINVNMSFYEI